MIWELSDEGFESRPYISLCAYSTKALFSSKSTPLVLILGQDRQDRVCTLVLTPRALCRVKDGTADGVRGAQPLRDSEAVWVEFCCCRYNAQ
jgi:hypothetical protein